VTAARFDPASLSSLGIDEVVRASLRDGGSLYLVDAGLLAELGPDLIVTQDLCAVCAVSSSDLAAACPIEVEVLSLDPRTFGEVAQSVRTLASRLGVAVRGDEIAASMLDTVEQVSRLVEEVPRRRVFFAEWTDPPFCAGHWLPEMIGLAGGVDVLGRAGEPSRSVTWEEVFALAPELVIVGPCGFGVDEAASRAAGLAFPCPAVAVDGDAYYSRPGPRLADGIQQLAHLLHPEVAPDPGLPAIPLGGANGLLFAVGSRVSSAS
jgi:iron complex transport system substrate-binding protein